MSVASFIITPLSIFRFAFSLEFRWRLLLALLSSLSLLFGKSFLFLFRTVVADAVDVIVVVDDVVVAFAVVIALIVFDCGDVLLILNESFKHLIQKVGFRGKQFLCRKKGFEQLNR